MLMYDVQRDLAGLASFYEACVAVEAMDDEQLFEPAPNVSAWSPGHHLFHVCLANELAFRNVTGLIRGKGRFIAERGETSLLGHVVMLWEWIPRGVGQSPRTVRPPERPNPEIVRDTVQSNRATLAELSREPQRITAAPAGIPHQDLGWLPASGWLRFARLHGWHHLKIMRECIAANSAAIQGA